MEIKILDTNHSGNWITASETKPEIHDDELGIVNAEWSTNNGRAEINTRVVINTDALTVLHVSYRYISRKYNGGGQYWSYYRNSEKLSSWKSLTESERMDVLDEFALMPGWVKTPGKLARDYKKRGWKNAVEMDEQGTIYAYKYLRFDGSQYYSLASISRGVCWFGGELEADQIPTADNTNGIYCMKVRDNPALDHYCMSNRRLVKLALSGTVVEADEGYRAQHAQIVEML